MARKFRGRKKLGATELADLRVRLDAGQRQVDLAIMFGITQAQVSYIKNGKRRKPK